MLAAALWGLVAGWLLGAPAAQAQIVHENPSQVKAANRRALRDAQNVESPYKDSHLTITPARLKRGQTGQSQPQGRRELNDKTDSAPNKKPRSFFGLHLKKKQPVKPKTVSH